MGRLSRYLDDLAFVAEARRFVTINGSVDTACVADHRMNHAKSDLDGERELHAMPASPRHDGFTLLGTTVAPASQEANDDDLDMAILVADLAGGGLGAGREAVRGC